MAGLSIREKQEVISAIDQIPAFRTAGVAFVGRDMCMVVRQSPMPVGLQTWVVLKEEEARTPVVSALLPPNPSNLKSELLNMGLSCGSALLAGTAAAGSIGAAPVTGGASLALTVVVWAGSLATAAQCGIATGRLINEIFDPGVNEHYLDSEEWYQNASTALDAISIAGGVFSLGQAAQAVIRVSQTSGRPLTFILRGMTRAERKRLAQDLTRYTGQAPTRRQFIRLAREGRIPKLFSRQQVNQAMINQLLNSISSGLTFAGSATAGVVRQMTVYLIEQE